MSVSSAPAATAVVKPIRECHWPDRVFRYGRWISIHNWTDEERNFLRNNYRYTIASLKELAKRLNLTANSVRQQLSRMGLLKLCVWWAEKDQSFLEENYGRLSLAVIANRLGRSVNSVVAKAHRLEVRNRGARDGWFTMEDVARILGVDQSWIKRRLRNGFKFEMEPHDPERLPAKGSHAPWHISEKSLKDFIRRYPEELTGHNVDFVMLVDILAGVKG